MTKILSILLDGSFNTEKILNDLCPNSDVLELQCCNDTLPEIGSYRPDLILLHATSESSGLKAKLFIRQIRVNNELRNMSIAVLAQEDICPAEEESLIDAGANIIIPTPSDPALWKFKFEKLISIPERHKLRAPVQIITWAKVMGVENLVQGMAFNINLGGMLLQLPIELAPDTKIDIVYSLPGDSQPLSCVGRIVWQDKKNNRCGVEFLAQRGDSRERLSRFLDKSFPKPEQSTRNDSLETDKSTEEVRWESLLRANEARKNAILNAAFDCIVAVDQEDKILEFNEISENTFGYAKAEILLRRKLDSLLYEDTCLLIRKRLFDYVENIHSNVNDLIETKARRRDGSEFPVEIRTKAIYAEREALLIINIRDVSHQKKMMSEYNRAAQLAALGTVAAGVAHEINNPLQGILNYATLLSGPRENTYDVKDISRRILNETRRIEKISKQMLHYSNDSSCEKKICDIHKQIESALCLLETKVRKKGQTIVRDFTSNLPKIKVNPQGIQQVIMNLVDNASDAISSQQNIDRPKDITVKTTTHKSSEGVMLTIEVYDEGVGMPRNVIARATEAFFSTKPSEQGTGLGLSIVNDIIRDHQGVLHLESEENLYTKAHVILPL